MSGYSAACSRQHSRNRPSHIFMIAAWWTAVTVLRLCSRAYLNANCAMRSEATRVITLRFSTTPGTTSCSKPAYSPSVFSRMVTMSTPVYGVLTPGSDRHGRTLAYKLSALRSVRLSERCPLPIGVANGPFSPTLFRITLLSASSEIRSPPGVTACVEMVWYSQSMGTPAASKIWTTASEISGPIPSPGKMVTVRFSGVAALSAKPRASCAVAA
mmetsp:Transcript_7690/g.24166  ORF Transcript_7690/g.24166 Transcript_7690/m.24166 type:complete len:214 (-) Transcript_7690:49-690(-)